MSAYRLSVPTSFRIILFSAILAFASHQVLADDLYGFPYGDPYTATVATAILKSDDLDPSIKRESRFVEDLPGRSATPFFEGRGTLNYMLYSQKKAAPLMFILAGLGGTHRYGVTAFLSDLFYKQGFNVIAISSPYFWRFALSSGTRALPGITKEDAQDVYRAMQVALDDAKKVAKIKTHEIGFVSVSMGALEGAYISALDRGQKKLNIKRFLLINPPVDLLYGLNKLDSMTELGKSFTGKHIQDLRILAFHFGYHALMEMDIKDPAYFADLEGRIPLADSERQFLLGKSLREPLADLIFTTQQIHDLGILKTAKDTEHARERIQEAKKFSFKDYMNLFVLPQWNHRGDSRNAKLEELLAASNFAPIAQSVRENPRVYLMHNENDFLVTPEHIEFLRETFGPERSKFYPIGGHVGNIWYPDNRRQIVETFRFLLD